MVFLQGCTCVLRARCARVADGGATLCLYMPDVVNIFTCCPCMLLACCWAYIVVVAGYMGVHGLFTLLLSYRVQNFCWCCQYMGIRRGSGTAFSFVIYLYPALYLLPAVPCPAASLCCCLPTDGNCFCSFCSTCSVFAVFIVLFCCTSYCSITFPRYIVVQIRRCCRLPAGACCLPTYLLPFACCMLPWASTPACHLQNTWYDGTCSAAGWYLRWYIFTCGMCGTAWRLVHCDDACLPVPACLPAVFLVVVTPGEWW